MMEYTIIVCHLHMPLSLSLSLSLSFLIAVFIFLSGDLSRETLSKDNEQKRTKYAKTLEELLNKIQVHRPAHDNRGTNGTSYKPPPPPPSSTSVNTHSKHPIPDHEPTDYLTFEPSPLDRDETQEVYEAMEDADEVQELYVDTSEFLFTCYLSFLGKLQIL